jgi:UDP-2,3-diacylglucosamine hydrolase
MGHSLFISDLHLCDSRPHITQALIAFLAHTASKADALYILGDLFEYWVGDDAIRHGDQAEVIVALKQLAATTSVYFMAGNRDFLIGQDFAQFTGMTILPDPSRLTLYGKKVLLSHGDSLCTDDTAYQTFRAQVRTAQWQTTFLQQPYEARIRFVEDARMLSEREKSTKSMAIMDVNPQAVEALLRQLDYPEIFIHGHTHRPGKHQHLIQTHTCERYVLGDWYEQGSYLRLDAQRCELHYLE